MALPPVQPSDPLEAVNNILGTAPPATNSFLADSVPSDSGLGTRQSRVQNLRPAVNARNIIYWLVPEMPMVQMYINPQNITYSYKKGIASQRTKGGFMLQYWGEELTTLRLVGTTGTSGIEGINVLSDLYRAEQLALDPYALFLAAAQEQTGLAGLGSDIGNAIGGGVGGAIGSAVGGLAQSALDSALPGQTMPTPSLAQFAFTVEMYWSGEVYRGYFASFTVTESVETLGMFNYDIEFMVTQKRGFRQNFLPWHRSATSGPSNSDPYFGTPHSFGQLLEGDQPTPQQSSSGTSGIVQSVANSLGFDF